MGNYLKMADKQRIQALLELGWNYRRIQRETGVRRETIARYAIRGDQVSEMSGCKELGCRTREKKVCEMQNGGSLNLGNLSESE